MAKTYLCIECDFHGTDDQFSRNTISEGYNYGHGNAMPEEVELRCPECGMYESEGIVESLQCDYCEKHYPIDDITQLDGVNICVGCKVARNIMKGENHVI